MLKWRWRILFNRRYTVIVCIALHNLCIEISDPCQPRSRLEVDDLDLIRKILRREEDKAESSLNRLKTSNWLCWNLIL